MTRTPFMGWPWSLALAWLVVCAPARASGEEPSPVCAPGDLLANATLTRWLDTRGTTSLLTDGAAIPEGARWASQGVTFTSRAGSLTYDLGAESLVGGLYFQGEGGADFAVLLSIDGKSWRRIAVPRIPGATGMRSRTSPLEKAPARYVRVGEPSEPGAVATELRLFCELPASLDVRVLRDDPAPPVDPPLTWTEQTWLALTGVPWLVPFQANALKLALVLLGVALVVAQRMTSRLARTRDALLLVLGIAGYSGYYNWGAYRFPDYAHEHELFHYVVGAKYFRELGYLHLYECANAADAEDGFRRRVDTRQIRDLRTGLRVDAKAALERSGECQQAFTPQRWAGFKEDVAYFRDHAEPDWWDAMLRDHGFNPSPVWTMTGSLVANARPASRSFVGYADSMTTGLLALIDPLLVLAMLGLVAWAFGWRIVCLTALVFGCNPLASFLWTGGSYLRQDWLALAVAGVCLLRKSRPALGGAALAYSAMLRVFPGAFLVPIAARVAWIGWRERRLDRAGARVLAGAIVAAVALAVASSAAEGGAHVWPEFAQNTARLTSTPSRNLVGLRTVLSFRPSTRAALLMDETLPDPFAPVREARRTNFTRALPVYVLALVALVAGLLRAVKRIEEPWQLACLGAAVAPIVTEMSCYYSSLLVVAALLASARAAVGLRMLVTCAAVLALHLVLDDDVLYVCASVAIVAFSAWTIWAFGGEPKGDGAPLSADAGAVATGAGRWLVPATAIALALLASSRRSDPLMARDRACEEAWTDLAGALRARAALARKKPPTLPIVGEDLADPVKVATLVRAQAELRAALGDAGDGRSDAATGERELDEQITRARERYDDAVASYDVALAQEPAAIDRATGRRLLPRLPLPTLR